MSNWLRICDDMLNDPRVQRLDPRRFKSAFLAASRGLESPFTPYVRVCNSRPSPIGWAKIRARIFARDDYTCRYCGERGGRLECDHVIAVARGGNSEDANLATACFRCNRSKRSRLLEEWDAA